jgi:TonB family protein
VAIKEENLISADASIIRAASDGDADAVRALLVDGADVDQRGRGGHTALMIAAIISHVEIADLLLGAGADVQLLDNLGLTARDWADRRGSWEVAQLLSNASPAQTEPSPKHAEKRAQLKVEAEPRNPAAEPKIAPQPDALRFMKFHKQIMAAQERRKTEQVRREAEGALRSSPIETNISPQPEVPSSTLSEQGALATWSSTGATQPETDLHAYSETNSPNPNAHKVAANQQTTMTEREQSKAEAAQPTARQSARIAATIKQLRTLEESRQGVEGDVPAMSDWAAQTSVDRGLDLDERDTTLERPRGEMSHRPAMLAPKRSESLNPSPIKRCPKCNTAYDSPLPVYCAYDATKLISADDSGFSYSTTRDRSRQTLGALIAIVTVLGVSLGYLINNYRSRQIVASAPVAAVSNAPGATQTEPPEPIRNVSPLLSAELSGMEVEMPEPEYPAKVRADGISDTITVRVQVNKNGRVVLARSSHGDWRLRAAAVKAAQKATFSPEKLAARGKVVSGSITYTFVAQTESPVAPASLAETQTNSPAGASSSTGASVANVSGDHPVVGGPLVGAESKLPQAEYPDKAKSQGINGTITVVVRVNRAGKVISWRTLDGDSELRAAALKAAKKATFSPEKLPGNGEVVGSITYTFTPSSR